MLNALKNLGQANCTVKTKIPIISEIEFASWFTKSPIIGITGSNGKTTTKDLLYHIFKNKYMCSKTIGNFNSSIGFPISFLNTNLSDNYSILEYGASKPNEIKYLLLIKEIKISFKNTYLSCNQLTVSTTIWSAQLHRRS